jgi:type IV secretion system protein VirD4
VCEFGHGPGIVLGAMDGKPVRIPPKLKVWMNRHVLVVGTPGSGKSRAYVRPNVMTAVSQGISVLVTDPKGEIYGSMAPWLRSRRYAVRKLDLVEMPESDRWNPLGEIREPLDADVFAEVVISATDSGAQKGDGFWNRAEQNLLKALVLYVCYDADGRRRPGTVGEIYDLVALGGKAALDARFTALPKTHPAYGPYMISKMAGESVWGNIVIGLGTRLQTFQQEQVRRITGSTEIDLTMPGERPCAYFVITPDTHGAFNFLASLFFTFLFVRLVSLADSRKDKRLPIPVRALLDEFANIVVIPEFEKKIATVRSRGIECHVIIQGLPQLERKYGRTWEEILSCCDSKLVLSVKDKSTAQYVSQLLGRATVETESESYGPGGDRRVTRSTTGRDLMALSEVVNSRSRTCLAFLPDGTPPARLRTMDYTEFPEAAELAAAGADRPQQEASPEQPARPDAGADGMQKEERAAPSKEPGDGVPPDIENLPETGEREDGEEYAW